ncbi:MAG: protein phosphatase 2C domain-containing protein [Desulforhabdus sp.]|nr:protein phosphatase 2C domain-containing protein [Desulforhabdus sp.]
MKKSSKEISMVAMSIGSITHKGLVRKFNEDRLLVERFDDGAVLAAVADGMGEGKGGALAAETVVQSLRSFDPDGREIEDQLTHAIRTAHQHIISMAKEHAELSKMGTTVTAMFLREGIIHWAHTGDSRAYLFRDGHLIQITDDHSITGFLLRQQEITADEAIDHPLRNVLLRCVGCGPLQVDTGDLEAADGDLVLLTTDGLHDHVTMDKMVSVLGAPAFLDVKLESLAEAALKAGGKDNITAVAVEMSFR